SCDAPMVSTNTKHKAIRQTFEAYREAVSAHNGKAAADLVTSSSISKYQEFHDLAVTADKPTLESLPIASRFFVMMLRHRIDADLLKSMDGKAVFAHAVDQDWMGNKGVVQAGVGNINIREPRATGTITIDGKRTSEDWNFVKEEGSWKLDVVPQIR